MESEEVQVSSQSDVRNVMEEMRQSGKMCDVVIKVGESEKGFSVHRIVLSASIPFFRAMFTSDMLESHLHEVKVNGVEPIAMEALINFAYSGKITINTSNVHCLLHGASYLQLDYVKEACAEFLKQRFQSSNVLSLRSLGRTLGCCALTKAADTYLQEYFLEVSMEKEFLELDVHEIRDIISDDQFHVDSESLIFEAVTRWVKKDVESRAQHLSFLLTGVRIHLKSLKSCRGRPRCYIDAVNLILAFKAMVNSKFSSESEISGLAVMRDKLYVIKGWECEDEVMFNELRYCTTTVKVFDVKLKVWTEAADLNFARNQAGVAVLNDQHLFVIGGRDPSDAPMNMVEKYDAIHDCWSVVESMAIGRSDAGAVGFEECVYALGGLQGYEVLNSVEKYDPRTDQWTSFTPMPSRRCRMGVAVLGGKIYVCGGYDGKRSLRSVEVLDPVTKEWSSACPMNVTRSRLDLVAGRGKLFAVGGYEEVYGKMTWKNTAEIYDPETDTWTFAPPMSADSGEVGVGLSLYYKC